MTYGEIIRTYWPHRVSGDGEAALRLWRVARRLRMVHGLRRDTCVIQMFERALGAPISRDDFRQMCAIGGAEDTARRCR